MKSAKKRFNEKWEPITESGCWLWVCGTDRKGYGHFWYKGSMKKAHRISYMFYYGLIPKNMLVLHKCDIPSCVNPKHLFLGLPKDNTADMMLKRRGRYISHHGESHGMSKLTSNQILKILGDKRSHRVIAKDFNIHQTHVSRIKRGKSWKNIRRKYETF